MYMFKLLYHNHFLTAGSKRLYIYNNLLITGIMKKTLKNLN